MARSMKATGLEQLFSRVFRGSIPVEKFPRDLPRVLFPSGKSAHTRKSMRKRAMGVGWGLRKGFAAEKHYRVPCATDKLQGNRSGGFSVGTSGGGGFVGVYENQKPPLFALFPFYPS